MAKLQVGVNDLKTWCEKNGRQSLLDEWDYKKNNPLTPENVTKASNKSVWWVVKGHNPITNEEINLSWMANIKDRLWGCNCPYLSGQSVLPGYNDIETLSKCKPNTVLDNGKILGEEQINIYIQMIKEWDYIKNAPLTPKNITPTSNKKVSWKIIGHSPINGESVILEWDAFVYKRAYGANCPYFTGFLRMNGYNDLDTLSRCRVGTVLDNGKTVTKKMINSYRKQLKKSDNSNKNEINIEKVIKNNKKDNLNRLAKYSPGTVLSNGKILTARQSNIYKNLLDQWDYEKNKPLLPEHVGPLASYSVWWKTKGHNPITGEEITLSWRSPINTRSRGTGLCPYMVKNCARILSGYNDLETLSKCTPGTVLDNGKVLSKKEIDCFKIMVEQWDYDGNKRIHEKDNAHPLIPSMISPWSNRRCSWKINGHNPITTKDVSLIWLSTPCNRMKSKGCPYLSLVGARHLKGYNDLKTLSMCRPRTVLDNGRILSKEQIDIYKQMVKEWDFENNSIIHLSNLSHPLLPEDVTPFEQHTMVMWHKTYIDSYTKEEKTVYWADTCCRRACGKNSPNCMTYKGERTIFNTLTEMSKNVTNFSFIYNKALSSQLLNKISENEKHNIVSKINNLLNDDIAERKIFSGRFDFCVNEQLLIEYDGKQHFDYIPFFHKSNNAFYNSIKRDCIKNAFASVCNLPLLRIPYENYDPIKNGEKLKKIITDFLSTGTVPDSIINWYNTNGGKAGKIYAKHAVQMNKQILKSNFDEYKSLIPATSF